ncbi:MAG: NUDIX hydrolase [Candidatus Nomurabacteria bacterium GW2011_GWF2_43_8]|uniref:NUDIX hydrolase n=3 Tax=Candidatus Nomuraibacteriota TaxID=1752729 RepID=A0A0G1IPS9_9BACT|nr:MAG: NUDIX hydrolase [Candidatus Nomurabacteria bacterium GW2011_GWA2_43_15]KKT19177.1 MAG: NUDIX hydrolase [Candidatus Nomurabacteria bacterium GW2011_GWB1_43_7]KKT25189.1 MAG: NUDIX hydrolase [Candidatus Nomurabacteria bacterium GW2011_GWF2_43_8]
MEENRAKFTIGVFGIIFNEQRKVLLVHRTDYDLWNLPGGGLEKREPPWEGVKREVKEETGFDVEVKKLVGFYSKKDQDDLALSFLCKIIGGQATLNNEADKIEYFEVDKLPLNTIPKQVERIKDALQNSDITILKIQTGKSSIELAKEGKL